MEEGHIVELEMKLNRMHPKIPKNLNQLKHLRQLHLYITNTKNVIPVLNRSDSLENLEIMTRMDVIIPDAFDLFPNLKRLRIRSSREGRVSFENVPDSICNLYELKWLKINDVHLTELPSDIGNLTNLEWLRINNTGLESIPESIYKLNNLRTLSIKNNPIKIPEKLKHLDRFL